MKPSGIDPSGFSIGKNRQFTAASISSSAHFHRIHSSQAPQPRVSIAAGSNLKEPRNSHESLRDVTKIGNFVDDGKTSISESELDDLLSEAFDQDVNVGSESDLLAATSDLKLPAVPNQKPQTFNFPPVPTHNPNDRYGLAPLRSQLNHHQAQSEQLLRQEEGMTKFLADLRKLSNQHFEHTVGQRSKASPVSTTWAESNKLFKQHKKVEEQNKQVSQAKFNRDQAESKMIELRFGGIEEDS